MCPRCQQANPPGSKFCQECGARLSARCPSCGAEVPGGAKFCNECGQALVTVAAGTPGPRFISPEAYTPKHLAEKILTSKSALEGERKQVTVLFADLKGSMELLADRDPEEARKLLDPVLERMMEAVHRYEGTVNQVMGDGIMALFGAPVAHEDHTVRACYAALDMQAAIRRYAEEVRRTHGFGGVQIRVGLNSGEVVVRAIGSDLRMDYTAVGQTTHLAARMEQLASPGSTVLTVDALRLAEGYVEVKPLGPVPVKGLEAPIEVYEMVAAGPRRSRLHAAAARGFTRFVGRETELEQLRQALSRAGSGHGQVVAIVGEPGVGKSRLVWEVTHSHRTHGWLILEASSVSYGKATPYLPVIDLLKGYFQIEARDDHRKIREKLTGKLFTLDEALRPALPVFLAFLDVPVEDPQWQGLDPPQRRQRTLDALKHLLLWESRVQPLLLVFEDLHWIDTETQALLDSLVESLPTARLLLLVNYRPEYQHPWGSKTYYTQLRLDPLPPESAEQLLQALTGDDRSLQPLKKLLIERTEGNPFFLEESVRTLGETQVLVGERGAYRLAKALPSIQVPATVQAVLAARIDRLHPEEKTLLQTAAVIGKDVPFNLLQPIAELPEEALRRGLTHLRAAEFLYEASLFPELEYTFKHALTHEVAYGGLLQERRRALHARIVRAIKQLYAGRLTEQVERLAHHAVQGDIWEEAVGYLQRAGQRAIERSANLEAVSHLTKGVEVLKALPATPERLQQELGLQMALGQALSATRGYASPDVEQAYARARELCQQVGEIPRLFPVLFGLWFFYHVRAEFTKALELAEHLLTLAEREQDRMLQVPAHWAVGGDLFHLGEHARAQAHLEQGIALYDSRQHGSYTSLYAQDPGVTCRGYVRPLWLLGYPDQALQRGHEAMTLAQELAHPFSLAFALNWVATVHQFRREVRATQERAEALIALSTEQGFAIWVAFGTVLRGWALAEQGRREEGMAQMHQGMAAWRATGAEVDQPYFLAVSAEVYAKGGQVAEALALLAEALVVAHKYSDLYWEPEVHRLKGEFLLQQTASTDEEAETCFRQALDVARHQQAKSLELRAALSLSRLWKHQGRQDEARRLLAEIYGWFAEGFDTRDLQEAKVLLEELL
jgi:class 3 adenylate cyclase/predicted ATPase